MKLKNKIAIVTGADSGIGRATAVALAAEGAHVAVSYHTDKLGAEETSRMVEIQGQKSYVAQSDIANVDSVEQFFAACSKFLGVPDVLVANAGVGMSGMTVENMENEKFEQVIRTDLMGPLYCARAFLKARGLERGRILFIGSVAGHLPTPESAPYGMAKAGINSLVRSLSRELAARKINVNAIAPGLIATPMTQKRLDDPASREEAMQAIPWHRPGQPEEIAELAAFLVSDKADYVTGQTWVMDGGLTMNWGGA